MPAKRPRQALKIPNPQKQQSPHLCGLCLKSIQALEPEHFHIRTNRCSHRDLRLFLLLCRRSHRLGRRFFWRFCNRWLIGQWLERDRQLFGEFLQQHTLSLNLRRCTTRVLFLQMNDAVIANLPATVDQTPLSIEDRRLRLARVQARDGQQYLNIRCEAHARRRQHHTLTVQMTRYLTQQQLIDVGRKAAGPTTIGRGLKTAIRLTLQQRFTLQVIGNRYRAEQYRHARALRRLSRTSAVQLIQRHRLVNAATRQAKNASEHQNKRKAQSSHRPIQVVATRHTTVKILNKYEERSATPALGKAISSVNMRSDSSGKASIYALNRRSSALARLIEVFDEQRIYPLEAPWKFVATTSTLTFVVFEVVRFQ